MEGGAWNSGAFEIGRDGHKARAPPTAHGQASAMEAGATMPTYSRPPTDGGKHSRTIGVVILTLRSLLIVFTLIALGLMVASKQKIVGTTFSSYSYYYFGTTVLGEVKFSDVHAFVGLVSVVAIVCFYSVVQLVLCVVQVLSTGKFISSVRTNGSLLTFVIDSVLAYTLIAAAAAAGDSHAILKDNNTCSYVSKFCSTAQGSIAVTFIAFLLLAVCAALFPIRLYSS